MKVAIIFASQTGNTAQVALAVREGCSGHEIVAFGPPPADVGEAELVFAGSWTDRGTCAPEMRAFLHTLHGKNVVLFGTAGFGLSESYFASLGDRFKRSCRRTAGWWTPGSARGRCHRRYGSGMSPAGGAPRRQASGEHAGGLRPRQNPPGSGGSGGRRSFTRAILKREEER